MWPESRYRNEGRRRENPLNRDDYADGKNRDSEGSEDPSEEVYLSDVNPTQSPCSLGRVVQAFWASGSLPVTSGS